MHTKRQKLELLLAQYPTIRPPDGWLEDWDCPYGTQVVTAYWNVSSKPKLWLDYVSPTFVKWTNSNAFLELLWDPSDSKATSIWASSFVPEEAKVKHET